MYGVTHGGGCALAKPAEVQPYIVAKIVSYFVDGLVMPVKWQPVAVWRDIDKSV